jgi:hypothetical protein
MTASAEQYSGGSLTNKDPKGTKQMTLLRKVTMQDVLIIAVLGIILFTAGSAIAAEMNGTLTGFNGQF